MLRIVDQLSALSKHAQVSKYSLASIYIALGDKDRAFALLNEAYNERAMNLEFLKVEPEYDPLRSDGRFEVPLKKMKLQ